MLVTGGTGMLGSHLLFHLTSKGQDVRATYRTESKIDLTRKIFGFYAQDWQKAFEHIEWVQCDLEDVVAVSEAMQGIKQVYHCAALVSFAGKHADEVVRINVRTTANLMNEAMRAQVKKLVHVSSVAALGRAKDGEVKDENTTWTESKQNSAYARSKYLSELEAWRAGEEGLDVVIVNPCIILGPGVWQEGSAAMFGKIANGFKFYTEGVNAYVDARDVAKAIHQLMQSDISGERFVLASENKSYKEVFNSIAQCLDVKPPSVKAKPWMGNIVWRLARLKSMLFGGTAMVTPATVRTSFQNSYYSSEKIKQRLNFEFRPVEESIEDICEMYKQEHS